ncbi:hypothetical protein EYF80_022471 [Liparis tanakae]|uniref:Uncharacterized protein n=1 Tax=Liparis tanakae TaxID=230148 RepID=A0A4Z2HQV8_9TELE|nr:hypothetical protein EYF80_022471 [Liparis tanakae]
MPPLTRRSWRLVTVATRLACLEEDGETRGGAIERETSGQTLRNAIPDLYGPRHRSLLVHQ